MPHSGHRHDEPADAQQRQRLAAVAVALLRPVVREQHPQHRRPGVGDRHPEIGDADLAPDRRHDRLQRGIARRGDQHRREQQQEMRGGQRRRPTPGCARSKPRRRIGSGAMSGTSSRSDCAFAGRDARVSSSRWNLAKRPVHLPTLRPFNAPLRSFHAVLLRAHAEKSSSAAAQSRPPRTEPAVAIPARLHQESGDGRLDHPVEPHADRQDARPGRLGEHQVVRRIWAGRRHLHPADPRSAGQRRDAAGDRHQPGIHAISAASGSTIRGWSRSPARRPTSRRSSPSAASARPITSCRACPSRPCRRASATAIAEATAERHPAGRRVPRLSVQPQGARFHQAAFRPIKRGFEWINVPPATLFWA